jgi:hypothetical protein
MFRYQSQTGGQGLNTLRYVLVDKLIVHLNEAFLTVNNQSGTHSEHEHLKEQRHVAR